jgi:DnaJ-domain-containing protein 1
MNGFFDSNLSEIVVTTLLLSSPVFMFFMIHGPIKKALDRTPTKFSDFSKLTFLVKFFLYANITSSVFYVGESIWTWVNWDDILIKNYGYFDLKLISSFDFVNEWRLPILFISIFLFLSWIYRANSNAWVIGGITMEYTPVNAMYCFFGKEFISAPYDAMQEIWVVSKRRLTWMNQEKSKALKIYFCLFSSIFIFLVLGGILNKFWDNFIQSEMDILLIQNAFISLCFLIFVKNIYNFQLLSLAEQKYEEENTNKNSTQSSNHRIILCPDCSQKIRFSVPLTAEIIKCQKCDIRLSVRVDDDGHVYINPQGKKQNNHCDSESEELTIDDYFKVLGLSIEATPVEVKAAYKKKIKEYHPDKVSMLGEKLITLAEDEAKKINNAYSTLKELGYA